MRAFDAFQRLEQAITAGGKLAIEDEGATVMIRASALGDARVVVGLLRKVLERRLPELTDDLIEEARAAAIAEAEARRAEGDRALAALAPRSLRLVVGDAGGGGTGGAA